MKIEARVMWRFCVSLTWYTGDAEDMRGRDVEVLENIAGIIGVDDRHFAAVLIRRANPNQRRHLLVLDCFYIFLMFLQIHQNLHQ